MCSGSSHPNMSDQDKQAIEKVKKESATPTVSTVLPDGSLAEMVYRPEENRTLLCVSKNGDLRYEASLLVNGLALGRRRMRITRPG